MKFDFELTFTNVVGFIAFIVGALFMIFKIEGGSGIALAGLGLVGAKKIYDMVPGV